MKKHVKISKISLLHYVKLCLRCSLFLFTFVLYIINKANGNSEPFGKFGSDWIFPMIVFIFYLVEMVLRFFPSHWESMGCQKQFKINYKPMPKVQPPKKQQGIRTFIVAAFWFVLNGIWGILYFTGVFDEGILVLIALAYGVCDIICILFFCPFQTWIMKNRCCTTCRIYNWDYAMMFTPLIFVKNVFALTLVEVSLALLIKWEILYRTHPERFTENTNKSLQCKNCKEKLCHHKTQLRSFLLKQRIRFKGNKD